MKKQNNIEAGAVNGEIVIEGNRLQPTGNPIIFVDKEKGELFCLEYDAVKNEHYLKKLNNGSTIWKS
jgi:hypothetical protein